MEIARSSGTWSRLHQEGRPVGGHAALAPSRHLRTTCWPGR